MDSRRRAHRVFGRQRRYGRRLDPVRRRRNRSRVAASGAELRGCLPRARRAFAAPSGVREYGLGRATRGSRLPGGVPAVPRQPQRGLRAAHFTRRPLGCPSEPGVRGPGGVRTVIPAAECEGAGLGWGRRGSGVGG